MSRCHARFLAATLFVVAGLAFQLDRAIGQPEMGPPAISSDRPGQGTPPSILLPGYVQLEAGFQLASDKVGDGDFATTVRTLSLPGALFRIGVFNSMELRIGTEFRSVTTEFTPSAFGSSDTTLSGITGITLGTKLGIVPEEGAVPETGFLLTLGIPEIGSESFRPQAVAPSFAFLMRNALSSSVNLYYNLGASWDGVNPTGTGSYALILGLTLADNLGGFAEVYGSLKTGAPPLHAADAGLSLLLGQNLQLDLFTGAGITDNAPDLFVNAGACVRLPR